MKRAWVIPNLPLRLSNEDFCVIIFININIVFLVLTSTKLVYEFLGFKSPSVRLYENQSRRKTTCEFTCTVDGFSRYDQRNLNFGLEK